jgi:hypothetical protein
MLLAVLETPEPVPDSDIRAAAAAMGLALADVRLRLAGPRPRIVLQDQDGARVAAAEEALRRLQWRVQAFDAAAVPTDADRVMARRGQWDEANRILRVWDDNGQCHEMAAADVSLLQRALRLQKRETQSKTSSRQFAPVRALLSGGLLLTKKVETTTTHTTEQQEAMLVLHRRDGEEVAFYERQIDYRLLGPELQPSSQANFVRLIQRLRGWLPKTPFDERALRPGVLGLQGQAGLDPTDLALYLVALAHAVCPRESGA